MPKLDRTVPVDGTGGVQERPTTFGRRFGLLLRVSSIPVGPRGGRRRVQQAPLQHFLGPVELRLPGDLRLAVRQAVAELLQRVAGHVRALVARAGDARHRMVAVLRVLAAAAATSCSPRSRRGSRSARVKLPTYLIIASVPPTKSRARGCWPGTPGARSSSPPGSCFFICEQVADAEDLVDHARAVPQDHLAAGDFLQIRPEVPVGHEQDLVVRRHPADDLLGVAAR